MIASREVPPRGRVVRALVRMLLTRNRRVAMSATVAVAVLIALDAVQGGLTLLDGLTWALGGAIMLPLASVLAIVREKADGTLRYLALLPIDGTEHALARGITSLVLALPAGIVATSLMRVVAPGLPLGGLLAACGALTLALASTSLLLTAFQYSTPIGRGAASAMYGVVGVIVVLRLGQAVWDAAVAVAVRQFLATQTGLVIASLSLWVIIGIVLWIAARLIAHRGPRYRGEVAEA